MHRHLKKLQTISEEPENPEEAKGETTETTMTKPGVQFKEQPVKSLRVTKSPNLANTNIGMMRTSMHRSMMMSYTEG